ncbi:MAG: DUF2304 family protein [Anaerolineae bacterium]|nr:DUF2304 family protein [Anaerolineae bacterium]
MSLQGILLIDFLGLLFCVLILNLVRTHKLQGVYGVIWLGATFSFMLLISIPWLLALVTRLVGATYPASAMSLLAFAFLFAMFIFFSVQLSALSTRQAQIAQAIAVANLLVEDDKGLRE